jgi:hypothetical protein
MPGGVVRNFRSMKELSSRELVTFSIPYQKGVILSEAPSRSIAYQRVYGAKSKDPGGAFGQMLFGAFRPRTTREVRKVTACDALRSSVA